jgi:hypothetical protein
LPGGLSTKASTTSVANASMEFDENDWMKPSAYHDRLVDVMEDIYKFTLLTRDIVPFLVDRQSKKNGKGRVGLPSKSTFTNVYVNALPCPAG